MALETLGKERRGPIGDTDDLASCLPIGFEIELSSGLAVSPVVSGAIAGSLRSIAEHSGLIIIRLWYTCDAYRDNSRRSGILEATLLP